MKDDIFAMVRALENIERVDISLRNGLYRQIHHLIQNYLEDYCDHHMITDLIDIDPERSQIIRYCEHCGKNYD